MFVQSLLLLLLLLFLFLIENRFGIYVTRLLPANDCSWLASLASLCQLKWWRTNFNVNIYTDRTQKSQKYLPRKKEKEDEKKRKGTKKKKKKSKRTITSHTAHTFTVCVCLHVVRVRTSKSHRPKMCLELWNIGNHRPSLSLRSRTPQAFSFERFSYFFFSFAMSLCTIYPKYTHTHTYKKE